MHTAAHLINQTPSRVLDGKIPFEVFFGTPPQLHLLKVFGCLCYVHNKPLTKDKFGPKSRHCIFLGYPHGKKGWNVYDLDTREMFVSRDVRFVEDEIAFAQISRDRISSEIGSNSSSTEDWFDVLNVDREQQLSTSHQVYEPVQQMNNQVDHISVDSINHPRNSGTTASLDEQPTLLTDSINHPLDHISVDYSNLIDHPPHVRRSSAWMFNYICHSARTKHPISASPSAFSSAPPGTRYPTANYVQYNIFSNGHKKFWLLLLLTLIP